MLVLLSHNSCYYLYRLDKNINNMKSMQYYHETPFDNQLLFQAMIVFDKDLFYYRQTAT